MNGFTLLDPSRLTFLLCVPVLLALGIVGVFLYRGAMKRFFDQAAGRSWAKGGIPECDS